jgi:hypothetical protein
MMMKIRMNSVPEVVRGDAQCETQEAPQTRTCFGPTLCLPQEKWSKNNSHMSKMLFICLHVHEVCLCPNCSQIMHSDKEILK